MPARTQNIPAMSAPPWPMHATPTAMPGSWAYIPDLYAGMVNAGCTFPADLVRHVQALATAADWRATAADDAARIDVEWNDRALIAARQGEAMPDIAPLILRQQLLSMRSELGQRLTKVLSDIATAMMFWIREHDATIVTDHLRPAFEHTIADAASLADEIPPTVLDDGAALRSGHGVAWINLAGMERQYDALVAARNALAEISNNWPAGDPRRAHLIGAKVSAALIDREPTGTARFIHRVRNRNVYGLWMPTAADVEQLLRGDDR